MGGLERWEVCMGGIGALGKNQQNKSGFLMNLWLKQVKKGASEKNKNNKS
jgi:hypothetical protein